MMGSDVIEQAGTAHRRGSTSQSTVVMHSGLLGASLLHSKNALPQGIEKSGLLPAYAPLCPSSRSVVVTSSKRLNLASSHTHPAAHRQHALTCQTPSPRPSLCLCPSVGARPLSKQRFSRRITFRKSTLRLTSHLRVEIT